MHYYKHSIGDYRRDTAHLSILEHGVYRQLLDQYYLDELPLHANRAKLMRLLCVRSAEEIEALDNVLTDFFLLTDSGYIHKRCDVEIEAYHAKSASASESAKTRWQAVRAEKEDAGKGNNGEGKGAMRSHSKRYANHKPLTINQEPLTISTPNGVGARAKPSAKAKPQVQLLLDAGVDAKVADDYLAVRKAKKGGTLTATAFEGLLREATAAGITVQQAITICCERNWIGFRADWDWKPKEGVVSGVAEKPWYITAAGIEEEAKRRGIVQEKNEIFPAFKVRVYLAAQVTPEMVRAANIDFQQPTGGFKK